MVSFFMEPTKQQKNYIVALSKFMGLSKTKKRWLANSIIKRDHNAAIPLF
jgi:hypothetical protein